MGSLIPIMIAAHKTAMVISRYSFTIALMGVVVACGAALGSMFGTQLFKKFTIFSMTILATLIALMTTFAIFATSIYLISINSQRNFNQIDTMASNVCRA